MSKCTKKEKIIEDIKKIDGITSEDVETASQYVEERARIKDEHKADKEADRYNNDVIKSNNISGSINTDGLIKPEYKKIDNQEFSKVGVFRHLETAFVGQSSLAGANAILRQDVNYQNAFKEVMDTIYNSINGQAKDVETMFEMYQTDNEFTEAYWTPEGLKIGINEEQVLDAGKIVVLIGKDYYTNPSAGILASKVYHEMIHAVSEVALDTDYELNKKLKLVQSEAIKQLSPASFYGENPTPSEIEHGEALYRYISAKPSEFMAYGISDPEIYNALTKIKISTKLLNYIQPDKGEKLNGFQSIINNFIKIINNVYSQLKLNQNAALALKNVTTEIIQKDIALKLNGNTIKAYQYNNIKAFDLGEKYNKVDEYMKAMNENIEEKISKLSRFKPDATNSTAAAFMDKVLEITTLGRLKDSEIFQSLWHTLWNQTTKKEFAKFYELFRKINMDNNKHQVESKDSIKKYFEGIFADVEPEVRASVSEILSADWKATGLALNEYVTMLDDNKAIDQMISQLRSEVGHIEYESQARDLGWYMMHNEAKSAHLMKNASFIYHKKYAGEAGIAFKKPGETDDVAIERIDRLASLYAMKYMDTKARNKIIEFVNSKDKLGEAKLSSMDALEQISNFYYQKIENQKNEFGKSVSGLLDKVNVKKDSLLEMKFDVVPESALEDRLTYGFKNTYKEYAQVQDLKGSKEKHYLLVGEDYSAPRTQGSIDDVGFLDRATTMSDIYLGDMLTYGDRERIVAVKKEKLAFERIDSNTEDSVEYMMNRKNNVTAVFDYQGRIVNYGIELSNAEKNEYMAQNNDIVNTLAKTAVHSDSKISAIRNNMKMVDHLLAQQIESEDDDNYVTLKAYDSTSTTSGKDAKKRGEQWAMIPQYTKIYIRQRKKELMAEGLLSQFEDVDSIRVHKSLVDDIVGYKDPSFASGKLFGYDLENIPKVKNWIEKVEYYLKKIVSRIKHTIVMYLPSVIIGNIFSNATIAIFHGIGPFEYARGFARNWNYLSEHQELAEQINILKSARDSGVKNLDLKISTLEKELSLNPINDIINDGQYNLIIEDLNINVMEKSDHLENFIDKQIEKLPAAFKTKKSQSVIDTVFMTKRSKIRQSVEKITMFNDIVNRAIVKEKLMEELDRDINSGKRVYRAREELEDAKQDILNYVDQLYVNYSYLDNKYVKYANDIGLVWFTKYFFRAAKALRSMYERNPAGALSFGVIDNFIIDLEDPAHQYMSPFSTLGNKMIFAGRTDIQTMAVDLIVPRTVQAVFN